MSEHYESDPADALVAQMSAARAQAEESQLARASLIEAILASNRSSPFVPMRVDLSAVASTPQTYVGTAFAIQYRREGSAPGGRLDLDINGRVEAFYPGASVEGFFDRFSVIRNARSSVKGFANLLVTVREDAKFREPPELVGQICEPVDLLGTSATSTYVTVGTGTQPSGAAPTGSFSATGWSRIRVLLNGTGLTTVQLTPWVREPTTGLWFPQTTAATPISDTETTAYDRRIITFDLEDVTGLMFFEVTDNAGGNPVSMIVQGLR